MTLEAEALRYLGYKGQADATTHALISRILTELESLAAFAYTAVPLDISISGDIVTLIDGYKIESADLSRYLAGCKKALLFAATLGANVDRAMQRYLKTEIAAAAALQACAAALLEAHCDKAQDSLNKAYPSVCAQAHALRRFSPGYGDFSLHHQHSLLKKLDAGRKIGLSCTDQSMLVPTKSITAFIGVGGEYTGFSGCGDCTFCDLLNCPLRRDEI